jgi:hypothetical protein
LIVIGSVGIPVILKPAPETLAWEIETAAVPLFVSLIVCELLFPMTTLPKLALEGFAPSCGCTPEPVSEIVAGELVALLTTLRLPVALPAVGGAKLAVSVKLWPAARVTAPGKLLRLNPAPVMAACEMLTLAVPVFVSATVCRVEVPTRVLPKFRLLAPAESKYDWEEAKDAGVPVPETEIVWLLPPLRLVLRVMLPLKVSAASGWNITWKDALPWAPSVMGIAGLRTINSGRLLEACRIETVCPLLLVTTTLAAELDVFTVTDPKLREVGLTPTPARTGRGKKTEAAKSNPRDGYASRVLCICGRSFVFDLRARPKRGGGRAVGRST